MVAYVERVARVMSRFEDSYSLGKDVGKALGTLIGKFLVAIAYGAGATVGYLLVTHHTLEWL